MLRTSRRPVDLQVWSYNLFSKMLEKGNREILSTLFKAFVPVKENPDVTKQQMPQPKTDLSQLQTSRNEAAAAAGSGEKQACSRACREGGTNDPCLRQRGKYKHCHGRWKPNALPYEQRRSPLGSSLLYMAESGSFPQNGRHFTKGRPFSKVCFVIACPIKSFERIEVGRKSYR